MIVAIVQVHLTSEGTPEKREMHRFSSAQDLLDAWDRMKETVGSWLYVVNCSKPTSPPVLSKDSEPVPDGTSWCPYCADHRNFVRNPEMEHDECNVCGISDKDFYVRKFNSHYHTKHLVTRKGDLKPTRKKGDLVDRS